MISPAGNFKFYVASKPVDFRKGMDGLAAILCEIFPDGSDNTNWQCLQDGKKSDVLKRLQAIARGDFV